MPLFPNFAPQQDALRPVETPSSPLIARPAGDEAQVLRRAVAAHVTELLGEEDPEFVEDLVTTFCGSAHDLVAQVRGCQDLETVGKVAHQLKGSAANVGLVDLEAAWYQVETGARTGDATVLGLALANAAEMTERAATLLGGAG